MEPIRKNLHDLMAKCAGITDGFRGQHLVVLPAQVRRRAEKHPLLRGLLVTDAGVFPRAAGHLVRRAKGALTTLLICCVAGRGWARIDGKLHEVAAGTVAWLPARRAHDYGAAEDAAWTIEWAHFSGEEVEAWRELLRIPPEGGVLALDAATAAGFRLSQLWEFMERGYSLSNLAAASTALRAALSALSQRRSPEGDPTRSSEERVAASAKWMQARLAQSIRLEELAGMAALSVPHYCALFKRQTGFAPIDWLIRLRIQRACQLLDTTPASVAEIGRSAGFPDPYYFTRCFRRVMGTPPREYRRILKG